MAEDKVHEERAKTKAKAEADAVMARAQEGREAGVDRCPRTPSDADRADKNPLAQLGKLNEPPKLQETGLFSRRGEMVQDIGVSKELAKKAFEMKVGEVAGPFEVRGSWVIVRVKEHKDPDMADFEKRKDDLVREYEREKWAERARRLVEAALRRGRATTAASRSTTRCSATRAPTPGRRPWKSPSTSPAARACSDLAFQQERLKQLLSHRERLERWRAPLTSQQDPQPIADLRVIR